MKNLLLIFLLIAFKVSAQTPFPLFVPTNPDSIKTVVNVNGAPRTVYNIDLVRYRAALIAKDTAAALRLLIAGNTSAIATNTSSISANTTAIGLKADKSNTISINGTSQTLGSNPSFTVSGGSGGSIDTTNLHRQDSINYITSLQNDLPIWKRQGTVLAATVSADQSNVYEPTIIREPNAQVLTGLASTDTVFKMWYTGGWGTVGTDYAESLDGITWTKYSGNPIIANHCRNFVIKNGSTYVMYAALTAAATQIDRYTSSNGLSWTLANSAVITKGTTGTWNANSVHNSHVIIESGTWKMLLEGNGAAGYAMGYYTSSDGITWTPYASNPVISNISTGGPNLQKVDGVYWLYCHGTGLTSTTVLPSDIYKLYSTDLINWTRVGVVFARGTADEGVGTLVGQVADAFLVPIKNSTYLYYSASSNGSLQTGALRIKMAIANQNLSSLVSTNEGENSSINAGGLNSYINFNRYNMHGASPLFKYDETNAKILMGNYGNTNFSQLYSYASGGLDAFRVVTGNGASVLNFSEAGQLNVPSLTVQSGITSPGTITATNATPITINRSNTTIFQREQWQTNASTKYQIGFRGGGNDVFYFDGVATGTGYVFSGGGSGLAVSTGSASTNGVVQYPSYTGALVAMESTAKGFMPPRMTTAQRDAVNLTTNVLTNFNITSGGFCTVLPTVSFTGGTGSGASVAIQLSGNAVSPIWNTFVQGSGYTAGDNVSVVFSGGSCTTYPTGTVKVGQVGTMIYNTTTDTMDFWNGTTWKSIVTQ